MKVKSNHYLLESTEIRTDGDLYNILQRNGKMLTCTLCSKSFSSKHCLKEHGYTHSDVRPYKCKKCPKRFKHASQLSVHKKTHFSFGVLLWPKLTNLLPNVREIEKYDELVSQKIELPLISSQQIWCLPSYNFR